jgi:hypothetical protein
MDKNGYFGSMKDEAVITYEYIQLLSWQLGVTKLSTQSPGHEALRRSVCAETYGWYLILQKFRRCS